MQYLQAIIALFHCDIVAIQESDVLFDTPSNKYRFSTDIRRKPPYISPDILPTMLETTPTRIVLTKSDDYEAWRQSIKTSASQYELWNHIDPDFEGIRPIIVEPTRPTAVKYVSQEEAYRRRGVADVPVSARIRSQSETPTGSSSTIPDVGPPRLSDLDESERWDFQLDVKLYERALKRYDIDKASMGKLLAIIQESIGKAYVQITYDCDTALQMMMAIQAEFKPTDIATKRRILSEWNLLMATDLAKRITDVTSWLVKVESKYAEAVRYQVPEITPDASVLRFLDALQHVPNGSKYADQWDVRITDGDQIDLKDLIHRFRDYLRNTGIRQTVKGHTRTSAFGPTLQGMDETGKKTIPECLCGLKHWYQDCRYLNEKVRPPGWKPDAKTQQKIDEILSKDEWKRNQVKRIMERATTTTSTTPSKTGKQSSDKVAPDNVTSSYGAVIYPEISTASLESYSYDLRDSFILDSGSDGHVCNNAKRMFNFRKATATTLCRAGNSIIDIEGWGSVTLMTKCKGYPKGRPITLSNVALIPSFHCSLVSFKILKSKGMWWNTRGATTTLNVKEGIFCETPVYNKMWTVEYNPIQTIVTTNSSNISSFKAHNSREAPSNLVVDARKAHDIFGHINGEALRHLPETCEGLDYTGGMVDPNCEVCRLGNASQLVSRRPRDVVQEPFYELCWDIVFQDKAFDDQTKLSHLWCPYLKYHFVFGMISTSITEIMSTITYTVNYIELQYGIKVKRLSIDGEQSITNSSLFGEWRDSKGIEVRTSAPHAKQQHGAAERSGGVLTLRATKLHLASGIPKRFWRYLYETAGYLLNRSPTRSLGFKSPVQLLNERLKREPSKPSCYHLKPYGCRAYAYTYGRARLDKLGARAHVGYLVGYLSTNIWSIWVPSLERVVAMRDVTFDTTRRYATDDEVVVLTEEEADAIAVPQVDIDQTIDDWELSLPLGTRSQTSIPPYAEKSIDSLNDTIVVDTRQLPTPSVTPEPSYIVSADGLPVDNDLSSDVAGPAGEVESIESAGEVVRGGDVDGDVADGDSVVGELTTLPIQKTTSDWSEPIVPSISLSKSTNLQPTSLINQSIDIKSGKSEKQWLDLKGPASRNIVGNVDPANQITGKRIKRKSRDYDSTTTSFLSFIHHEDEFYASFTTAMEAHEVLRTRTRIHQSELPSVPRSWREMLRHTHAAGFQAAAQKEYMALQEHKTWEPVLQSSIGDSKVLPGMWVFTYKLDSDGYLLKYKARFVVRGDLYRDLREETYAATLGARVFRSILSIANHFDLEIHQVDAVNAFTNAFLDETTPIYIECPQGFSIPDSVLLLKRALYGLPQSPLLWYNDLCNTMKQLGLLPVAESACLFTGDKLMVFFYVDDICILYHHSNRDSFDQFKTSLFESYEMKDLGELRWFLGIRVIRDRVRRRLWLTQDEYITKIVTKYGLTNQTAKTPMALEPLQPYDGVAGTIQIADYQSKVGSVNYGAVITRPDVAFTASKLSEHLRNPGPLHIKAVERCICYLNYTRFMALEYGEFPDCLPTFETAVESPSLPFTGYSDASLADDVRTRRSTQGHKIELFGGTVDWQVQKQTSVATSSTEAELNALGTVVMWLLWYQRFFDNINLQLNQTLTTYCDNLQTVRLMTKESPKLVTKLKHIDIKQHWLREKVEDGTVNIEWISTANQAADGLTKALTRQKHITFLKQLKMRDISDLIAKLNQE